MTAARDPHFWHVSRSRITLVLRCSASERGGTARFASSFIGEREVQRLSTSFSRSSGFAFTASRDTHGHSEQQATESAVMAAEIEQLPDRAGFLKFSSQPAWMRVNFPYYDIPKIAEPFMESVTKSSLSRIQRISLFETLARRQAQEFSTHDGQGGNGFDCWASAAAARKTYAIAPAMCLRSTKAMPSMGLLLPIGFIYQPSASVTLEFKSRNAGMLVAM